MKHVIDEMGGTVVVARASGVSAATVTNWRTRGIPEDRCPQLELHFSGLVACERMRPDLVWHRLPDARWPHHPAGRPLRDVAINLLIPPAANDPQTTGDSPNTQETRDAA